MDSPPGMLQAETAGALDSMTGDGPSAPSGDGPQSPVDFDATDASNSSISTHGAGADQLPHEASVTSRQARPAPWPLHAAGSGTPMSRKRQNDGSTHKIFDYPETPGTGASKLSRMYAEAGSDLESDEMSSTSRRGNRQNSPRNGAHKVQAPGGPSSIVNPLALMSLRKQQPPPPPPPPTSRHLKNIEFGASLVAEAAVMMKQRLAEHTLSNLAGRISETFFKRSFLLWQRSASDSRNFLIRADRALCRLGLRVQRRALHCWQDTCVWSRVFENLAGITITRCWTKIQCKAFNGWKDLLQRRKLVMRKLRRGQVACQRTYFCKWRMSARISRVRAVQLARLFGRKGATLLRVSFAAMVAQHQAEKSLYQINRLAQKTCILSGAVILRAWREHIEFNLHMEKAGCTIQRRWDTVGMREIMREWLQVHTFSRIASHAALVIAQRVLFGALRQHFMAWMHVHLANTVMRNAGNRIMWKQGLKLANKAWARWVEARTVSRRLSFCYQIIKSKYEFRENSARTFQAWRQALEDSRRLKCVDKRFIRVIGQFCRTVVCAWRLAARRSRKFSLWHVTTDRRLKRIWTRNCFSAWAERSLEYWRSWRKCETLKLRLNSASVSLHLVSWKEKMRGAGTICLFAAKVNTRLLGNIFQEWSILCEHEIARAGRVESGVVRMAIKREYCMKVECTDLWYAKVSCRKRVEWMIKSSSHKMQAATKDKYLAAWMRRQDDVIMRRGRLAQNVRRQLGRLMDKGLWCLRLNCQQVRACSHRSRCIQRRLDWNARSKVFTCWWDLCGINQVKGKLYYGLVERYNHKAKSWSFFEWNLWLENRRRRQQKVHKALLMNVPRYMASWVLSTWADKHSRTMRFERLVLSRYARCSQGALDVWYDSVKDLLLQASCISKVRRRVEHKTLVYHLELWHEHTTWSMFTHLIISRADASSARGHVRRALMTWSRTVIAEVKKRQGLTIFVEGMTTRAQAALFSAWWDIVHDSRVHVMKFCSSRAKHRSDKFYSMAFHCWRAVYCSEKLRTRRLKMVCVRLLQSEIRGAMTRWKECSYDHALLVRKCMYLALATREHILQRCFRVLHFNAPNSQAVLKAVMIRWNKVSRNLLFVILQKWIQQTGWGRRKKSVISSWTMRCSTHKLCRAFATWTTLQRLARRLHRQVDIWDRRSASTLFDAWEDLVLHNKDYRIRAWLMRLRADPKTANQVFLFWANLASTHRARRIKMIKMHERVDSKHKRRVFMAMLDTAFQMRRRRLLQVKTARASERCKLLNATAQIFDTTRKSVRRRRVFSILVLRRHLKMTQLAWGAWLLRMESKKRMQAAYKMAIEMD